MKMKGYSPLGRRLQPDINSFEIYLHTIRTGRILVAIFIRENLYDESDVFICTSACLWLEIVNEKLRRSVL